MFDAELACPPGTQTREDLGAQGEQLLAACAASQLDGPGVCGVLAADHVAEALEIGHRLGRGLLADAETTAQLGDGRARGTDGLQGKAVNRTRVRMPTRGQLIVKAVDQSAERSRKQQR